MDGPEPTGEGGEAVEVVAGLVVAAGSSWMVVAPEAAVPVVDVGGAVFLVVLATSLVFGSVAFAVTVVDERAQILLVELKTKIVLVDLLFIIAMGSC